MNTVINNKTRDAINKSAELTPKDEIKRFFINSIQHSVPINEAVWPFPQKQIKVKKQSRKLVLEPDFLDESMIFPALKLEGDLKNQIYQFFRAPAPKFGPVSLEYSYENDMTGLIMEYSLRRLVGANVGGLFDEIGGYEKDNPWTFSARNKRQGPMEKRIKIEFSENELIHDFMNSNFSSEYFEKKWSSCPLTQQLYAKKNYVAQGLNCNSKTSILDADYKFEFKITIPNIFKEFQVPADVEKFVKERGGTVNLRQLLSGPTKFTVIQKNIFVDRKPTVPEPIKCDCFEKTEETFYELNDSKTEYIKTTKLVGCGKNCLNRCMFYECTNCPMGSECSNQIFQKRQELDNLVVFQTIGRGFGLKTSVFIPKGALVAEYRGEVISQDTRLKRMGQMYQNLENYYFLEYGNGEVIDGCRKGTVARFINHSCDPNCHIEKWNVNGEFAVGVFASRDLKPGEEIFYDYRFMSFGPMQQCMCGADNCRGFLGKNRSESTDPNVNTSLPAQKSWHMLSSEQTYTSVRAYKSALGRALEKAVELKPSIKKSRLFLLRSLKRNIDSELKLLDQLESKKAVNPASFKKTRTMLQIADKALKS